jgi:hypothetical protein
MLLRFVLIVAVGLIACDQSNKPMQSDAKSDTVHAEAAARILPTREAADTLISSYLDLIAERDGMTPEQFRGMRAMNGSCVEEMYGDSFSTYWLARGRILDYKNQSDTLRARLELITVAEQVPVESRQYDSEVRAHLNTDTLIMRLVPDSSGERWQICGYLSNGYDLGSYGKPENVRYKPTSKTRSMLLREVDSIRGRASRRE